MANIIWEIVVLKSLYILRRTYISTQKSKFITVYFFRVKMEGFSKILALTFGMLTLKGRAPFNPN